MEEHKEPTKDDAYEVGADVAKEPVRRIRLLATPRALRYWRLMRGIGKEEVARKCRVPVERVTLWEQGSGDHKAKSTKKQPTVRQARIMAKMYEVGTASFLLAPGAFPLWYMAKAHLVYFRKRNGRNKAV